MRRISALLVATSLVAQPVAAAATPFINEFHYDNIATDEGEFIELAGGVGWDLSGWSLALYNGTPTQRRVYDTRALSGVFSDQANGWGLLAFDYPVNGIQNGDPDGVALVDNNNNVINFLSYEGSFTAASGPAAGLTSTDIGVSEGSSTPVGASLQLTGTQSAGFTWTGPVAATKGLVNTGQVFDEAPPPPPPPPPPPGVTELTIAEIQGAAQNSPEVGNLVRTTGIVTQVASNGYYLQSDMPDGDTATSEGIFVFVGGGAKPDVGDLVRLDGTVSEFLPGGNPDNLTVTQLSGISNLSVLSAGNTVTPTVIGAGGRTPPTEVIENDPGAFEPNVAGRDFYESLEGMLVTVAGAVAVGPTNRFGEIFVRSNAPATGVNARGGITVTEGDFNPERIQIDPAGPVPDVSTGAQLSEVTGVVSYNFGNFEVVPPAEPTAIPNPPAREVTSLEMAGDRLRVATYNVENLAPGETDRYDALAQQIITGLRSPEVIGLQEILADDPGATLQGVVAAITAAGGPSYQFGFQPAQGVVDDRIVNAFLYDPARVTLVGSIDYAPGATTDPAFDDSRAPLVATFRFNGQEVTVVNNHFSSRGGSDPLFGSVQPPVNGSEARRQAQAEFVNAFVDTLLGSDPNARVAVIGDLNSFEFEDPQIALRGLPGDQVLFGLFELIDELDQYSFIFDGNSQLLDYIYATNALFGMGTLFDIVHFNVDFFEGFSDHDPLIASFLIAQVAEPEVALILLLGLGAVAARRRRAAIAA